MKRLALCALTVALLLSGVQPGSSAPLGYNTGTLGGSGATVAVAVPSGGATCTVLVASGLTGTIAFEVSVDQASWQAVTAVPDAGSGAGAVQTVVNPGTGSYQIPVSAYGGFRVRVSSYGSGSAPATVACSNAPPGGRATVSVTGFPTPFPTSSPGGAQVVVLANPSAVPYTAAAPAPVSTAPPCTSATCSTGVGNGGNSLAVDASGGILSLPELPQINTTTTGNSAIVSNIGGASSMTLGLTGTWTGNINVQGSQYSNGTWTTLPGYAGACGGLSAAAPSPITANGVYCFYTAGFYQIRFTTGSPTGTIAYTMGFGYGTTPIARAQNSSGASVPIAADKSVAVAISTATTTSIVALSGSTGIYVTGYHLYIVSGTTPGFKWQYGTGATCGTGTTDLSGVYGGIAGAVGQTFEMGGGFGAVLFVPAGNRLCIVSSGTTPNIQGFVTYAQF